MKKLLVLLFLAAGFSADAQKLKDLLYSGKLRSDSNSVVRRSDDLSTKIDTGTRKPVVEAEPAKPQATANPVVATNPATVVTTTDSQTTVAVVDSAAAAAASTEPTAVTPVKSNTKIWKEYSDSLLKVFNAEVVPMKRLKKETYYVIVEYEIGPDGAVAVGNISSTPENAFLQSEVKTRMETGLPQLAPTVDSSGKPRKTKRKWSFTLAKD